MFPSTNVGRYLLRVEILVQVHLGIKGKLPKLIGVSYLRFSFGSSSSERVGSNPTLGARPAEVAQLVDARTTHFLFLTTRIKLGKQWIASPFSTLF